MEPRGARGRADRNRSGYGPQDVEDGTFEGLRTRIAVAQETVACLARELEGLHVSAPAQQRGVPGRTVPIAVPVAHRGAPAGRARARPRGTCAFNEGARGDNSRLGPVGDTRVVQLAPQSRLAEPRGRGSAFYGAVWKDYPDLSGVRRSYEAYSDIRPGPTYHKRFDTLDEAVRFVRVKAKWPSDCHVPCFGGPE